jgi:hypothetical protein
MSPSPGSTTEFLNVNLDLRAPEGLDDLAEAFGASVIVMQRATHLLSLEMNQSFSSVEETLVGWVSLVEKLPPRARALWDQCELRSFNIGIRAGESPHQAGFQMSQRVVSLLAEIGSEIAITVYVYATD